MFGKLFPGKHAEAGRTQAPDSAILIYHNVSEISDNPLVSGRIHNVRPDHFYKQVKFLKEQYDIISIDAICERVRAGQDVTGCAAITFDDGYRSVLEDAQPILAEFNVEATVFLVESLFRHGIFWRDRIRFIVNEGLTESFLAHAGKDHAVFRDMSTDTFYRATKQSCC